jgi:lipoprotein-anchoring transpeptidase ErfK/SrfK
MLGCTGSCASEEIEARREAAAKPELETAPDFESAPLIPRDPRDAGATVEAARASAPAPAASPSPRHDWPGIAATAIATTVYKEPNPASPRLGYIRLGGVVQRAEQPVTGRGCSGFWYPVHPVGHVCSAEATIDLESPLVRAAHRRPAHDKPLPYSYGFVRATAPQYLRIPTHAEQFSSEFKLDEHLKWYDENRVDVQRVSLGSNDVPLDSRGIARIGEPLTKGQRLSTQLDPNELYGGGAGDGHVPFWLLGGRQVPNVSGFSVPQYAAFADRVRRKTGLSFVDSFVVEDAGQRRGFAVTVDLRLVPTTKVKPDTGSAFHGIEMGPALGFPFAIVLRRGAHGFQLIRARDATKPAEPLPHRALIPMSGNVRFKAGRRFYQTRRDARLWLAADDIAFFAPPPDFPSDAARGKKWIDVSLVQQTLVLYEGREPKYATLISSGQDRLGDPKTEKATPRGRFEIKSKHIAAAMDSEENSSVAGGTKTGRQLALSDEDRATIDRVVAAKKAGRALSEDDRRRLGNIEKGRPPEYGVTRRRGSSTFELRDVPWIQYFDAGFALHGAYWHDVFGLPRSHGCINLSPIDARVVFNWTEPSLPEGWHGFNVSPDFGPGTVVVIRE